MSLQLNLNIMFSDMPNMRRSIALLHGTTAAELCCWHGPLKTFSGQTVPIVCKPRSRALLAEFMKSKFVPHELMWKKSCSDRKHALSYTSSGYSL